jgi:hypothetical protein
MRRARREFAAYSGLEALIAKPYENRAARRYNVEWAVCVAGKDNSGNKFQETTKLKNVSSTGAAIVVKNTFEVGQNLDVFIRVPVKKELWMKHAAVVVRFNSTSGEIGLKFYSSRPVFLETAIFGSIG